MQQQIIATLVLTIFIGGSNLIAETKGSCLEWSEGDAQHLSSCKESTLSDCSKGHKPESLKATSFQNYKGKLFRGEDGSIFEFRSEPASSCKALLVRAARDVEGTMGSQWGYVTYSEKLKAGDNAFVYGVSVSLRESPNTTSKILAVPADRSRVKVISKSAKRGSVAGIEDAYWFQVTASGKKGWIYGKFLHPDPNSLESYVGD